MSEIDLHKTITVLKCLMNGIPVKMDDRVYRMTEDYELCVEMDKMMFIDNQLKPASKICMPVEFTVGQFIRLCDKIDFAQKCELASVLALNDIK